MSFDPYYGIKVGDTVRRTQGYWSGHGLGWTGVVVALENGHLLFADTGDSGHSPSSHEVVSATGPVDALFERRTQKTLHNNH